MSGRPEVIVDVVFEDGLFFLSVANIGDRPALDVQTTFNRKLVGLGGTKDVAGLPLFRNIPFLAPGKEIRTLLDSAPVLVRAGALHHDHRPRRLRRPEKEAYKGTMTHDLEIYRELAYPRGD